MMTANPKIKRVEMKCRLDASLSDEVRAWAREHLGLDENCNSETGDSYDINTLYLDTVDLDLFHRAGKIGAAKHRIRRYGNDQTLWLETKRKKKMIVRKNRSAVFESDLFPRLLSTGRLVENGPLQDPVVKGESSLDDWCGDWFMQRIVDRQLHPAIQIAYRRFARTSMINGESLRLTIDSQMRAGATDGWRVSSDSSEGYRQIDGGEILELKFHNKMPHLFKELLRTFPIPVTGFSKYRTAIGNQNRVVGLEPKLGPTSMPQRLQREHSADA